MFIYKSNKNSVLVLVTILFVSLLSEIYCEVDDESSVCEELAAKVSTSDHNTVVHTNLKMLSGTWFSEGCETIPGPEYIIRTYTFNEDGQFKLIQHRYWDDSCSSPKFTIVGNGKIRLKRDTFLYLDASVGATDMINITIIPQDKDATRMLDSFVSTECPGQHWKAWRQYEEHIVYEKREMFKVTSIKYRMRSQHQTVESNHHNLNTPRVLHQSSGDLSCLGSIKWAFNELKLIKVQLRPLFQQRLMRLELLLGDIHSKLERREFYTPTAFQVPLIKYSKGLTNVTVNGRVYTIKSSNNLFSVNGDKLPPHLHQKLHLPLYICGEWISIRCEIRPSGLYLKRKFSFYSENSVWIAEHTFYLDSFCTFPKFAVTAAGHFTLSGNSKVLTGSTNIDFSIEKASLTVLNSRVIHEMKLNGYCGRHVWVVGVPQELSSTKGCLQLGFSIPSIQYEVIKVEMDYEGTSLLFMGQADTDNLPRASHERPTAFQPPLVMCSQVHECSYNLRNLLGDDENVEYNSLSNQIYVNISILYFFISVILYIK